MNAAASSLSSELRELYSSEFARLVEQFKTTGDGRKLVTQRAALVALEQAIGAIHAPLAVGSMYLILALAGLLMLQARR